MKDKRILIAHDNQDDFDGNKHDFLMYKYKDYIFRKEWYMNMENEFVCGLTLFKKGKPNNLIPHFEYQKHWYNEIFHSGNFIDTSEDTTGGDDETIEFVEQLISKDKENK